MIQGSFPRLKDNMLLEDFGDQKIIMNLVVALYNFQPVLLVLTKFSTPLQAKLKGSIPTESQWRIEMLKTEDTVVTFQRLQTIFLCDR